MKYFRTPRERCRYIPGRHDYQSIGSENGIGEFFEAGRLFGVGSW